MLPKMNGNIWVATDPKNLKIILQQKDFSMQKIMIEVKDDYTNNILEILHGLNGVMIDKIKLYSSGKESKVDNDLVGLQFGSMSKTWDNQEDEAWDDL